MSLFAFSASRPLAIPITATLDTSPSSSAFVACVVLWATKRTLVASTPVFVRTSLNTFTMPSLTDFSDECVVGVTECATTSPFGFSTATAWVNVPPTSMPISTSLISSPHRYMKPATASPMNAPAHTYGNVFLRMSLTSTCVAAAVHTLCVLVGSQIP